MRDKCNKSIKRGVVAYIIAGAHGIKHNKNELGM